MQKRNACKDCSLYLIGFHKLTFTSHFFNTMMTNNHFILILPAVLSFSNTRRTIDWRLEEFAVRLCLF